MKTVQQTPECTICSVNVNVHIASISAGRPLIKHNSESLPLASSFGYFTADNRTHTTTLVHHHFLHDFGRFVRSGDVMNGRNGSPSRAVIQAMVACKVLSLMLRQRFVIGPTLGFAATVCRLGWVTTDMCLLDCRLQTAGAGLMPGAQPSWQASSGLLPPCHAALSHSIHATRGHAVRLPAAIAWFHQHLQPASMHQRAPAAGGQGWGPRCRVYVILLIFAVKH